MRERKLKRRLSSEYVHTTQSMRLSLFRTHWSTQNKHWYAKHARATGRLHYGRHPGLSREYRETPCPDGLLDTSLLHRQRVSSLRKSTGRADSAVRIPSTTHDATVGYRVIECMYRPACNWHVSWQKSDLDGVLSSFDYS